jgi:hypothetical protein
LGEEVQAPRAECRYAGLYAALHHEVEMSLILSLEDLLGELRHARRQGDLGRLALIAYCEVRRWARDAGQPELAERSAAMITDGPMASREDFLGRVDHLIFEMERLRQNWPGGVTRPPPQSSAQGHAGV